MLNKDLEVKYHKGSITPEENKQFFKEMSLKEMWAFQDKVLNALWDKSFSNQRIAQTAEDRVLLNWIKEHPSD